MVWGLGFRVGGPTGFRVSRDSHTKSIGAHNKFSLWGGLEQDSPNYG